MSVESFQSDLQRINLLFDNGSNITEQNSLGPVLLHRVFTIIEKTKASNLSILGIGLQTLQTCVRTCPFLIINGLLQFDLLISILKLYQHTQPDLAKLCCHTIISLCANDRICHVVEKMLIEENLLDLFITICSENQFQLVYFSWKLSPFLRCPNRISKQFIGSKTLVDISKENLNPLDQFLEFSTYEHHPKIRTIYMYVRPVIQEDEQSTKSGFDFLNLKLLVNPIRRVNLRFLPSETLFVDSGIQIDRISQFKQKLYDRTDLSLNDFIAQFKLDPADEDDMYIPVELDFCDTSFFTKPTNQTKSLSISIEHSNGDSLDKNDMMKLSDVLRMDNSCVSDLWIKIPFDFVPSLTIENSSLIHLEFLLNGFECDLTSHLIPALKGVFRTLQFLELHYGACGIEVNSLQDLLCSSDCNLAQLFIIHHGNDPNEMAPFIASILRSNRKLLSLKVESMRFELNEDSMALILMALGESSVLHLDLGTSQFESNGLRSITASNLTSLDLAAGQNFTNDTLTALANAISSPNGNISMLKLLCFRQSTNDKQSLHEGIMAIRDALKSPDNKLISLDLSFGLDFGDFGAKIYSEVIPHSKLVSAAFGFCEIGNSGLESIGRACQHKNTKLHHIILGERNADYDENAMIELGKAIFYGKVDVRFDSYTKPTIDKVLGLFPTWVWGSLLGFYDEVMHIQNLKTHFALTLVGHRTLPDEIIRLIMFAIIIKKY